MQLIADHRRGQHPAIRLGLSCCLRPRPLQRNAWLLVPFFELVMSSPKDELHQWYVLCPKMYILVSKFIYNKCILYKKILIYTCPLQVSGRRLGLFGDHIVPAVLHRYIQDL